MSDREYIIFSDESEKTGKYFSNFYGGVIVGASQYQRVTERLHELKTKLGFHGEVKWEKVTERYLEQYKELMAHFFDEIINGHLKVRIMFTQNARRANGLTREDYEHQYFKLYYQFIKHAFGLKFITPADKGTLLRLYFDKFPDTDEKIDQFKGYLLRLQSLSEFRTARLIFEAENITEVRSHEHVLLQCLDIVLGSMAFRLNDKHKLIPEGQRVRGKRTRAKEALYKVILAEICKTHSGFNIGGSTGRNGNSRAYWEAPYMHWLFTPKNITYMDNLTKGAQRTKRESPTDPT